ncbi:hypothetical protein CVT25_000030 [Psilocybe cyanescens]|uniref:Spindle pole body component n=1 Tax=Psilocybe cyanescens TaxID=93625 RepID=A0A409VX42_PSICY|nr:hypothetical protein CVT25_000030 [Psilocybe cyanescens]
MFSPLSDFHHEFKSSPPLDELPRIMPFFFVPPLENKPQNPIMENLKLEQLNTNLLPRRYIQQRPPLPEELVSLALEDNRVRTEENSFKRVEELWKGAATRKLGVKNGLLSWDRLRKTHFSGASPTPFLSEQGNLVCTSVRYYLQPRLYNPTDNTIHLTQKELLLNLKMIVLGISSQYHVWEPHAEQFIQFGGSGSDGTQKRDFMLIHGNDEVVSDSFIKGFLKIGTLLRRLEIFLSTLRTRSSKEGPTIHSLAHSLSTTLDYLREVLARCQPSNDQIKTNNKDFPLLTIWSHYAIYEELLDALSDLYGRSYQSSPKDYPMLDLDAIPLISHIYEHVNLHFERQSPSIVRATLSFLLTITSQEYLQEVARSIGFGGQLPESRLKSARKLNEKYTFELDDDDNDEQEDIFDLLDKIETSFPAFFPQKVLNILPASQKSLVLLQIAKPGHLLLKISTKASTVRWFWSTKEILAIWDGHSLLQTPIIHPSSAFSTSPSPPTPLKTGIPDFGIFDLEPGSTASSNPSIQVKNESFMLLSSFIQNFPENLPPIVPTLSELTSLVFRDLTEHAATLSSSLLSLIIDEPGNLNFRSHLIILRSYLLIAAPSFKSRLLNALFSAAGEYEMGSSTAHSMSIRRRSGKTSKGGKQPWAVGLSPNLLERETWPPVGGDLSFFLRTVIVDSLDKGMEREDGKVERERVVEEAEWRLGFAIRDLPTGSSRDKWLDPLCIEALDFLYIDYKPPHLMEILISPGILSKYQRMFTFILRLFRVESALKSLFRMSTHRNIANSLFPTLSQSRKLLLHFRFVSQAFVSSLSGYVFDTAIGGNFDPFLALLSGRGAGTNYANDADPAPKYTGFSDVFELAQRHSALLDDILSACLLRSGQRGVGDLLRHCLELVLEFTIVVGELHRGRIEEYQAAPMIEELFRKFCTKMTTFTKVLKGLVDKSPSASSLPFTSHVHSNHGPTGGLEALHHLLVCIDLTSWWSNHSKRQQQS